MFIRISVGVLFSKAWAVAALGQTGAGARACMGIGGSKTDNTEPLIII